MKQLFIAILFTGNLMAQCIPHYVCNSTVSDLEIYNDSSAGTYLFKLQDGTIEYQNAIGVTGGGSSVTYVRDGEIASTIEILPSVVYISADLAYWTFDSSGVIRATKLHNSQMPQGNSTEQDIRSGTYIPTVTGVLNITSVTATMAQWIRVGNVVTVSGRFTADPIMSINTSFNLTFPIPSNISNSYDCSGTSFCGSSSQGAEITGNVSLDKATVLWKSTNTSTQTWSYTFTYTIY